jgi:hypothetical protein
LCIRDLDAICAFAILKIISLFHLLSNE